MSRYLYVIFMLAALQTTISGKVLAVSGLCNKEVKLNLPENLSQQIESMYPYSKVANENDYCSDIKKEVCDPEMNDASRKWSYGALNSDFNGDGVVDYTVIVKVGERYVWLVALGSGVSKDPYKITNLGYPKTYSSNVRKQLKNGKLCDGVLVVGHEMVGPASPEKPNFNNKYDFFGFESLAAGTDYYWENGKWINTGYEP